MTKVNLSKTFALRFKESDKLKLLTVCEKENMTPSSFSRKCILDKVNEILKEVKQ